MSCSAALCSDEDLTAMDVAANDPCAVNLILEGLLSGPMTPMTAEDWNNLRELVRKQLKEN